MLHNYIFVILPPGGEWYWDQWIVAVIRLSEKVWFVWSKTCYEYEKVRCDVCRRTNRYVKEEQYSALAESAICQAEKFAKLRGDTS